MLCEECERPRSEFISSKADESQPATITGLFCLLVHPTAQSVQYPVPHLPSTTASFLLHLLILLSYMRKRNMTWNPSLCSLAAYSVYYQVEDMLDTDNNVNRMNWHLGVCVLMCSSQSGSVRAVPWWMQPAVFCVKCVKDLVWPLGLQWPRHTHLSPPPDHQHQYWVCLVTLTARSVNCVSVWYQCGFFYSTTRGLAFWLRLSWVIVQVAM